MIFLTNSILQTTVSNRYLFYEYHSMTSWWRFEELYVLNANQLKMK